MSLHIFKLHFRRFWRKSMRSVEHNGRAAGEQFDRNLVGRLGRLRKVWKFVVLWAVLFLVLGGGVIVQISNLKSQYQVLRPTPGGMYSEGIQGSFTTANPLYAVSDVDTSVSRLLFAGLLTYDNQNHLIGDLADQWTVNSAGTVYTVHLRPNLTWQDGQPLTAADVVFTYQTIQNPDAQSPLMTSWQGVSVAEQDPHTVTFTLPNPLSSFPYSLTNGIVPQHLLQSLAAVDLRSATFNTSDPVGAGPFSWSSIGVSGDDKTAQEQIILTPFQKYWAGAPKLGSFSIHAYADSGAMLAAYRSRALTAIAGIDTVPNSIIDDTSSHIYNLSLTAGTYVFFKTTSPVLRDTKVRQALVLASNRGAIINSLGYAAIPVTGPLLSSQQTYGLAYAQTTNQPARANQLLDAAGWKAGPDGMRSKKGQPLTFTLAAIDNSQYKTVAEQLRAQWRSVGVDVNVQLQQPDVFQGTLSSHSYDALLYGISIGTDPDVFVYWDSRANVLSSNRLNFSEYSSGTADLSLEAGRTRSGDVLRAIKYRPFLQAWQADAPALGLYQPRLVYISHVSVYGLGTNQINTDADRFNNVQNWMIHLSWVTQGT